MARRLFSREFKVEAVRLVSDRRVSVAQSARDLDIHENMLRRWVKELSADPAQAFPGHGQGKAEQLEIERLRRETPKWGRSATSEKGRCLLREGSEKRSAFIA
jgi:transposase